MSIVKKTSTLLDDTIHISFGCIVHLHGHWNKVMPLISLYLQILVMTLNFIIALIGWLMTLEVIVFHIELITITSTMKT
jgi:hypothetical protein